MPTALLETAAYTLEILLWLAGAILLGWWWRTEAKRTQKIALPAFAPWTASVRDFILAALCVFAGAFFVPLAVTHLGNNLLGPAATDEAWWVIIQGTAFQVGLLAGVATGIFIARPQPGPLATPASSEKRTTSVRSALLAGTVTFLIALPVIGAIGYLWKTGLEAFAIPTDEQEMVEIVRNCDSPGQLVFMTVLAAVLAPLTEELVFRAGLFRFLRTRVPRWLAFVAPAAVFALLHNNLVAFVPLLALGLFFSFAYERTGRISVPVIAHALFNLHTILMILAGLSS